MTKIAIIIGSTRPGRKGEEVARWVQQIAAQRPDATFEIVDIDDYDLPLLDEPVPAAMSSQYEQPHTPLWAVTIESYDGFIFVTPEYNHSISGALKNAIDFLYAEWNNKAAGFVSYGPASGIRAVEHLRLIVAELKIAGVRTQLALSFSHDFENGSVLKPRAHQETILKTLLDELVAWTNALKSVRINNNELESAGV